MAKATIQVRNRPTLVTLILVTLILVLSACAGRSARGSATLQVVGQPEQAVVYVDEHFFGSAKVLRQQPAALPAGSHRITVQAVGYFPHDLLVRLPAGQTRLNIKLRAIPP